MNYDTQRIYVFDLISCIPQSANFISSQGMKLFSKVFLMQKFSLNLNITLISNVNEFTSLKLKKNQITNVEFKDFITFPFPSSLLSMSMQMFVMSESESIFESE